MKTLSLTFLMLIWANFLMAQQDTINEISITDPKTYTLKDIEIKGVTKYSKNQVLRFTGFSLGEEIDIPGNKINNAIKKLWNTNQFSDVEIHVSKIDGNNVTLQFNLGSRPMLGNMEWEGVSKGRQKKFAKQINIQAGSYITENIKNELQYIVNSYYTDKGFPDAKANITQVPNSEDPTKEDWKIAINKGPRVKIAKINIKGNQELKSGKIRKTMKNTKQKSIIRVLKGSKYIPSKFEEDLESVVDKYKSYGFRDAKINSTSVKRTDKKDYTINIDLTEGKQYYIGEITFVGNTVYPTELLERVLGYKKGDEYDAVGIDKKISGSEKDDDIHTLYLDQGYLFSNVDAIEKSVNGNVIDLEVRINEGEQATLDEVTFSGNTTTHDHVIQRSLSTRPGDLFSKSKLKRTYFELAGMTYFDPQEIKQDIKPDPSTNTVDIHWSLVEKSSSQVELQAGYGGGRFIGTLGLTFNNFSLRNMLRGKAWNPVPQGDGQQLSLRAQAGSNYQSYSLSFTEPWISGRRPTSLTTSFYATLLHSTDQFGASQDLNILGTSVGLNKLLNWPDDYFRFSQGLSYQLYKFTNYPFNFGTVQLQDGSANNFNYFASFGRYSTGPNPIFPTEGSEFEIGVKLTPPYSLFNDKDYSTLSAGEKYKWLEYYKIKLKAYWFQEVIGKLVLRAGGEMGFLSSYNAKVGLPPFERFFIGGTGLNGNRFDGREIIPLRGYEDATNSGGDPGRDITPSGGGAIYNKYLFELRYPISLAQSATIYALTFFEAGNTWLDYKDFKPFEIKRAAGVGVRIFMPAFGLIGFDFGYGFDKPLFSNNPSGWQTHFIIGQSF